MDANSRARLLMAGGIWRMRFEGARLAYEIRSKDGRLAFFVTMIFDVGSHAHCAVPPGPSECPVGSEQ